MNEKANDKVKEFTHCCNCGEELESVVPNTLGASGVVCKSCMAKKLRERGEQEVMIRIFTDLSYMDDSIREVTVACACCGGEVELIVSTEELEHARANTICQPCKSLAQEEDGRLTTLTDEKEVDLTHAKEVLTCSLCDSCGEVLPVEEFDDWYRCPDCSYFNEPPSWRCDSCDEPHQPAACHFCCYNN